MSMIEQRLKGDETAKQFLEQARRRIGDNPLRNALAAFYLQPGRQTGSVEFAHKSFSEFLFAERLKESWTEPGRKGRGFLIQEEQMHWQIYDLFGYGGLTPEVVEYLMSLVTESDEFRPVQLFQRLNDFYQRWCDGEFIDAYTETLPQKKSRQLHEQGIELGQRQVDIYAGLNAMILLLELSRYARRRDDLKEIVFYPSGQAQDVKFQNQLLSVIGYSNAIRLGTFNNVLRPYLRGAYLSSAYLIGAYLIGADLIGADLSSAYLRGAYLSGAYLIGADLIGADLIGADLSGAYLIGAYLIGADLSSAYLIGTCLIGADLIGACLIGADLSHAHLSGADLSGADLSGADLGNKSFGDIRWDENTKWEGVSGLETARNVPEALKKQLGLQ